MTETEVKQLRLDDLLEKTQKKSRSKPGPAICVICGKFSKECLNIFYYDDKGKCSSKKARVCPDCQKNPVKKPEKLFPVAVTTVATFAEICPEKALRTGGPKNMKIHLPVENDALVGITAHAALERCTKQTFGSLQAALGRHGLSGIVGAALVSPQRVGLSRGTKLESKKEASQVFNKAARIVRYVWRRSLVKSVSNWKKSDPRIIFAQAELSFQISFQNLFLWAGGNWDSLNPSQQFNALLRGKIDFLRMYKSLDGFDGPVLIIVDYKTFLPSNKELKRHKLSLQQRLYGLWASWAFGIPLKNILLRTIFVDGKEHLELEGKFDPEDPLATLRSIYRFLRAYHKVAFASSLELTKVLSSDFPPRKSEYCQYCHYREAFCSLFRRKIQCADCGGEMIWFDKNGSQFRCPVCMYKE